MSETVETRFGAYRVIEELAQGALSTIYKAVQEPLGRVVVVKALKTQIAPSSVFGEQLEREGLVLRDLVHPNIVLLLDQGRTTTGRTYLALEHVDGATLKTLLAKHRRIAPEVALAIAASVCAALEHAHAHGVVHRDVKPGNVLVARTGVVKLVDFGIAQRTQTRAPELAEIEGITPSGRIAPEPRGDAFGTPAYMSPEQILGDFVDGRSDLFSLGVVLYEMLAGVRPFEPDGGGEGRTSRLASRIRREPPTALRARVPALPREIERIVHRLLEKAPADRYASATETRERLEHALRMLTREDPSQVIRTALEDERLVPKTAALRGARASEPRPLATRHVMAGFVGVGLAFLLGVFLIERPVRAKVGTDAETAKTVLAADARGGLRVLATPWAHVKVDGVLVETTPFARPLPLSPGPHWVKLEHPDAPAVEREVDVPAGEMVVIDVTMDLGDSDAGAHALTAEQR